MVTNHDEGGDDLGGERALHAALLLQPQQHAEQVLLVLLAPPLAAVGAPTDDIGHDVAHVAVAALSLTDRAADPARQRR
jgi:hypothetical protein